MRLISRILFALVVGVSSTVFAVIPDAKSVLGPVDAFDFSTYPECNTTSPTNSPDVPKLSPDVPKLSPEFTIKVEGKSLYGSGRFDIFDSEGYYEAEGQRGATVVYSNGSKTTFLYDFISGNAYDIPEGTAVW